jgi:hypothetical protein
MKIVLMIALATILSGCPAYSPIYSNYNLWLGRNADELILHPVFATMSMDSRKTSSGIEIKTFKNSGGIASSGNCTHWQGFSNCAQTSDVVACNHVFYITNNMITDYKRVGDCGNEIPDLAPIGTR